MRELYVYYRVPSGEAPTVQAQVQALHRQLRAEIVNLRPRLLRRPDPDSAGQITFMETYATDPPQAGGVDPALQARIEAAACSQLTGLASARHVEVFIANLAD